MARRLANTWNKEIQRDILALGSPVFYFLVIGRALVGPFWDLFNPLIVLAPILYLISRSKLEADLYIARGFLVGAATTNHYGSIVFGLFAAVVLLLMIFSARNLGRSHRFVSNGIMLGLILSLAGLIIAQLSS